MNSNIASILKNEFLNRKRKNSKYSLRAFSRDLKMSPGFLSEVIQNKKKVSVDKAVRISQALGWTWRESQLFLQTAQLGYAKSKRAQTFLRKEISKSLESYGEFQKIRLGLFSPLSNWYFFAIVEMCQLSKFQIDPKWIGAELGINEEQARDALVQLKKAGLITADASGRWSKNMNCSLPDTKSADIRKFHKQHLVNAAIALEEQDFSKRNLSGLTMAIDSKKLPEALELIREFRSRMSSLLESGEKDSVYHLGIQLFQLDQKSERSRK